MRKSVLKITVGFTAFIVVVAAIAVWVFEPFSLNKKLEVTPPARMVTETEEQYIIYSVVINELFLKRRSYVKSLFIANHTSFYNAADYVVNTTADQRFRNARQRFASVSKETLLDFEEKRARPVELSGKFDLAAEYTLIDTKETKKNEGYVGIRLSQAGFNHDRTQAFVEIEYFCPLCGFGSHVLLEKENGSWKIKEEFNGWVS